MAAFLSFDIECTLSMSTYGMIIFNFHVDAMPSGTLCLRRAPWASSSRPWLWAPSRWARDNSTFQKLSAQGHLLAVEEKVRMREKKKQRHILTEIDAEIEMGRSIM
jgi:hypothetical protein